MTSHKNRQSNDFNPFDLEKIVHPSITLKNALRNLYADRPSIACESAHILIVDEVEFIIEDCACGHAEEEFEPGRVYIRIPILGICVYLPLNIGPEKQFKRIYEKEIREAKRMGDPDPGEPDEFDLYDL